MIILGINTDQADSSAWIIRTGEFLPAVGEERFPRIKHWAGLPREAIHYCLREVGAGSEAGEQVTLKGNPRANLLRQLWLILRRGSSLALIQNRTKNASTIIWPQAFYQEVMSG